MVRLEPGRISIVWMQTSNAGLHAQVNTGPVRILRFFDECAFLSSCRFPGRPYRLLLPWSMKLAKLECRLNFCLRGIPDHGVCQAFARVSFVSLPAVGLPVHCPAQNLREAPLPSLLTPESQNVLDKLASLSALPDARLALSRRRSAARGVAFARRCRLASRNHASDLARRGAMDAGHHRSAQEP